MSRRCRNAHPEHPQILCDRPSAPHPLCSGFDDTAGDYTDWPNPAYVESKVTGAETARARVSTLAAKATSERSPAARTWTATEQLQVRTAILALACERETFTADDVWRLLGNDVPTTPGLTALLREAASQRYIAPTDRYADSARTGRADHDHGRRLRVWRSLCQG